MVMAVLQVIVDWNKEQCLEFCNTIKLEAFEAFTGVQKNSQQVFNWAGSGDPKEMQVYSSPAEGLEILADLEGSKIFIDLTGFRIHLSGLYKGREYLHQLMDWVIVRLERFASNLNVNRVSVLFESNLLPPHAGTYSIEEYIVPNFEFADKNLDTFNSFSHNLFIDLNKIIPGRYRCRLELSGNVKRPGINILIDVLDDNISTLRETAERFKIVKDLESHVFESLITDKARELYGIIN